MNPKKILVVEDEQPLLDLYKRILEGAGYAVDTAIDGETGFASMRSGGYDLVLLDIIMPKFDGIQVLEKLQTDPAQRPNHAVLLLTNVMQDSLIAKALTLGVRGYLVKGDFTPDTLLEEVKKVLGE